MALTGLEKPLEQYNRDDIRKIAVLYGIPLSRIISQKLTKAQVIDAIRNSPKYQNQQQKRPTDDKSNRVRNIINNLIGNEDPDDLMFKLLNVLTESEKIPQSGKYYVFVYNPKTPNIQYDQNPLVAVTDIFSWGFRGINFHWGEIRQYTWDEVAGGIYEVYSWEIKDLQAIPFGKFRLNN